MKSSKRVQALLMMSSLALIIFSFPTNYTLAQIEPYEQTDLTISSVLLPETTSQGAEFGSQTRVTIYNQGTTIIEGGFYVEKVISSDREAPITPAQPTSTFVEDGLLPNGRVEMPTMQPEGTYTFTIPGMTMVSDAPLDELIFVCAVVDPEDNIDEQWRGYPDGYGVNKLCMPIDVIAGSSTRTITPPREDPPSEEPPSEEPPSSVPPTRDLSPNSNLADYDNDGDCALSDTEFFSLVDDWTAEAITNTLFYEAIDAWMAQRNICALATRNSPLQMRMANDRLVITPSGINRAISISIYDANGKRVHAQSSAGNRLVWNLRDAQDRPVANGVYFVHIESTGELRIFVILR